MLERKEKKRKEKKRKEKKRKEKERKGKERKGKERKGKERKEEKRREEKRREEKRREEKRREKEKKKRKKEKWDFRYHTLWGNHYYIESLPRGLGLVSGGYCLFTFPSFASHHQIMSILLISAVARAILIHMAVPATVRVLLFVGNAVPVVPKHCTNVLFNPTVVLNARVEVISGVVSVSVAK